MNDVNDHTAREVPVDTQRRRFCEAAIGGMALVSAGTVAYPVLTFLRLPESMTQDSSVEVVLSDVSEGGATWAERLGHQIVIVKAKGIVRAFDGACPHLGCVVQWDGATRTFKCPCHGAVFNDQGQPVAGPVNRPLEAAPFQVEDGILKLS